MNDNAKKWVAALRSGKYQQTTKVLKRKNKFGESYCCLGVACELYQEEVGDLYIEASYESEIVKFDEVYQKLPCKVKEWLGLTGAEGQFSDPAETDNPYIGIKYRALSGLNDGGESFHAIADVIESEPEGLFIVND
jgi:hypothetical protein